MSRVQLVWWWDRWYSLPRIVRWDHVFLDFSIIIFPLEIRVWKKPPYSASSEQEGK